MELRRFVTVVAVFFAVVTVVLFAVEAKSFLELKSRKEKMEKRMEKLASRRDRLNALSDSAEKKGGRDAHTEKIIREKLGLIKEGEKVFIFRR